MRRRSVFAVALAGVLTACSGPAAPASAPAGTGGDRSAPPAASATPLVAASPVPLQHVTIGNASPSLSYLPATLADQLGYYQEEGLAPEFPSVRGNAVIPALLQGDLDFTTLLSTVGASAGQGGATRIVQFHSVRLQHTVVARPEITTVEQLAGKRIAVEGFATLPAFEARKLVERFALPDVAILAIGNETERIASMEAGATDASISGIPANIVAEHHGFATIFRLSTILETPQAGFGTSDTLLREQPDRVARTLRAAARALPVIPSQRDLVVEKIAAIMDLAPEDAARAYELVVDTYSASGVPTDAQMAAYVELLNATAGVPADTNPAQLADFTIARRVAAELGLPLP
jgi:NitT/TauT family transport system substrate-binding protein